MQRFSLAATIWLIVAPSAAMAASPTELRWAGWCNYSASPGEVFPASRLNLPEWACIKSAKLRLYETYEIRTALNPFYLAGDFNGDGKQDIAVWVVKAKSRQVGLLLLHSGSKAPVPIGAGTDWDKRGVDYSWTDMWTIQHRGTRLVSGHEIAPRPLTHGDAVILMKSESAAFAVFWNGQRYRSYQLSD